MQRKLTLFLVFFLILGSVYYINRTEATLPIIDNGNYCMIAIENASYMYKEGYPILPYYVKTYVYPAGTKINEIEVKAKEIEKIEISKKIQPSPPAIPLHLTNAIDAYEGDIYNKDEFYPSNWYDYSIGMGIKDGKHVVFLNIYLYPVRYNALRNEVLYAKDFSISIGCTLPSQPLFNKDEYDLLIICPSKFEDELQELKLHKESYGIKTIIMNTESIYSQYNGRDEQEKIKYAIKDAIEKYGIKYVLLVGDADLIPPRYSYIPSGDYETYFPSDLYYADIYFADGSFSSWDTNNNDRFGEYKYHGYTDEVDLYPDVALGRLACSNEAELENVVNKIINYELTAYNSSWFKRVLACGGDTFTPDDGDTSGIYEGEYLNQIVLNIMHDFKGIKLWASLGNLSATNIKAKINEGVGFVDFSGHGNEASWATHPPLNGNQWIGFTMFDILGLSNGNKLPVIFIDACSCGRFDEGDCFAWKFIEKTNGGGIASLAASGIGYGIPGNPAAGVLGWMEVKFFYYYKQGKEVVGDTWTACLNGYLNTFRFNMGAADYKTVEELILFGDPTLKIGGRSEGELPVIYIENPVEGYLYVNNEPWMKTLFGRTVIMGKILIKATAQNVQRVEFYINGELKAVDEDAPYEWEWNEFAFGKYTIKVIGYGKNGDAEDEITVWAINLG